MVDMDRAQGLMEGIAVGNLLGIPMEGWLRRDIAEQYPGGVREIMASSGYPDDDDLAQAIIIAEASSEGPLDVEDLGRRFWAWGETNGLGMGGLTFRALALYGGNAPRRLARNNSVGDVRPPVGMTVTEASKSAWEGRRAGNGALMRCAPLAIRWSGDAPRLVRESVISAVPTHWDVRCGWSCALANLAAAGALRGEVTPADALLDLARDGVERALPELEPYGYQAQAPASVTEAVVEASQSNLADIKFDGWNKGYTLLTLQAALISYWRAKDFESSLSALIEVGGDTDTNGAAAGALLGARFGSTGIPPRWRRRVSEIRAERTPMAQYAAHLANAAAPPQP